MTFSAIGSTLVANAGPVPCATAVPLKTMFSQSPSAAGPLSGAAFFSTASLSPVNGASNSFKAVACTNRASVPTASRQAGTERQSQCGAIYSGRVFGRRARLCLDSSFLRHYLAGSVALGQYPDRP
jgi:hypothetical protein